MKKVLLLSSLAVSGVILAGCGSGGSTGGVTLDTLLEESNKVMDSVKSVSTNINIDVEMDMSASTGGNDISFEIKMTGEGVVEAVLDNFAAHQVMNMNVSLYNVDQASSIETYMIADANNSKKVDVYTNSVSNDAESGWLHTSIDMEDASKNLNSNLYNLYTNSKDSFSLEKKTKQFEGSECYVVNAKLGFKDIANYAGEILSQLDVDENSDLKIDTVYYIDKETKEVKGAEVDMADTMKSLLEESAQQSSNTGVKINIKAFKVTSENTYNTVTSIDIPKEVTEAAN